jgi:hypothetical protein
MRMDPLLRIKRLVLHGRVRLTEKAQAEMERDSLDADEVVESILNARAISKTLRSRSESRARPREKLYVIQSYSFSGTPIYTKGKILREAEHEVFHLLVSSKIASAET